MTTGSGEAAKKSNRTMIETVKWIIIWAFCAAALPMMDMSRHGDTSRLPPLLVALCLYWTIQFLCLGSPQTTKRGLFPILTGTTLGCFVICVASCLRQTYSHIVWLEIIYIVMASYMYPRIPEGRPVRVSAEFARHRIAQQLASEKEI